MNESILLEALKKIAKDPRKHSHIATEAIKKWEDSSKDNRCKYEKAVESFFGLPDTVNEKDEIKADFGLLVNLVAFYDQFREDSSGKETGRLDEFFKWIDNSEFPFIDGYWIAYFNEKDNQLTTHQLYQLYKSKQPYESVPPYKEEEKEEIERLKRWIEIMYKDSAKSKLKLSGVEYFDYLERTEIENGWQQFKNENNL